MTAARVGSELMLLTLRGEQDTYYAPNVERELDAALANGCALVVDLSETTFLDSVVAGKLLEARKEAKRRDLGFALVISTAEHNAVRRMFEQAGLTTIFATFESKEEALAAVTDGFIEPPGA